LPADAASLIAEVAALDEDLAHAMQHVSLLQKQLAAHSPGMLAEDVAHELHYLRQVRLLGCGRGGACCSWVHFLPCWAQSALPALLGSGWQQCTCIPP
jgi:hypothetical protein